MNTCLKLPFRIHGVEEENKNEENKKKKKFFKYNFK